MSKFYSFNNFNNNLRLTSGFNYNRYELKETLTDHSNIERSNIFNKKEIFLNINFNVYYSHNRRAARNIDQLNTDYLNTLNDVALNKHQVGMFNNLNQKNEFLVQNHHFTQAKSKSIYDLFGVDYINFEDVFDKNKKIQIDRNKISYIEKCNNNNSFFDNKLLYENDNSELYTNRNEVKSFIHNKKNFISDLTPYNRKNIYDNPEVYFSFVGFFVEKLVKENNSYVSLDKRFYMDNLDVFANISTHFSYLKRLSLKDVGIQYGKAYKYKVSPVYNITFPKFNDFHVVEDFLFCDVPVFTEDIICQESKRPIAPNNIKFKYNKQLNKLNITWNLVPDSVGDIKGFQIFKRSSLKEPFVLVKQIEYHDKDDFYKRNTNINIDYIERRDEIDGFELDTEFRKEKIEIYTICAIDAHGFISNYSAQLGVKFNYNNMKIEVDLVSRTGAPLNMPNLLVERKTKFFDNDDKIATITPHCSNVEKISIYATPDFATINTDELQIQNIYTYKEKYKFNIFKLENSENFIDTITIDNFNI
jgi:hypothetical protein